MKTNNVYSEVNLHINWHVKENYPVLKDKIEDRVHRYITHRVVNTPQAILRAVGGTDDHIHPAVSIHPTLDIAPGIPPLKRWETTRFAERGLMQARRLRTIGERP